jgi:hypothetical protein
MPLTTVVGIKDVLLFFGIYVTFFFFFLLLPVVALKETLNTGRKTLGLQDAQSSKRFRREIMLDHL